MLGGDPQPFAEINSHADDVAYLTAYGSMQVGWENIWKDWQQHAWESHGGFVEEIESHFQMAGDTPVIRSRERALLKEEDGTEAEHRVRETSVLVREAGEWKIVAHHANALCPPE